LDGLVNSLYSHLDVPIIPDKVALNSNDIDLIELALKVGGKPNGMFILLSLTSELFFGMFQLQSRMSGFDEYIASLGNLTEVESG
jgi:hypothetical protein